MKKILFLIFTYSMGGGAEALLTNIVNHLNPEKYDISIREIYHFDVKEEKVNDNVHVLPCMEPVETPEHRSKKYQIYNTPELLINKYVKGDYDLYISFNYQKPTFLLPKGTKNISWIHTDVYDLAAPDELREKNRQEVAFQNVQKIVSISDITTQSLINLFPNHAQKIVQIPNGLELEEVRKGAAADTQVRIEKESMVFVGRLEDRKDPVRLVGILKQLHEKGRKVHLYYLGQGELDKEIMEKTEEKELSAYVHLLGYHQNPFPILVQCSVNIFLSKTEGFGLGVAEGLALGVPFVGTDVGALKDLANEEKAGRIVSTDEEAANAVIELLDKDKEEIRRECFESVERYDMKNYIKRVEALLDEVLETD